MNRALQAAVVSIPTAWGYDGFTGMQKVLAEELAPTILRLRAMRRWSIDLYITLSQITHSHHIKEPSDRRNRPVADGCARKCGCACAVNLVLAHRWQ